jgi:hypothetical protein
MIFYNIDLTIENFQILNSIMRIKNSIVYLNKVFSIFYYAKNIVDLMPNLRQIILNNFILNLQKPIIVISRIQSNCLS